MASEGEDTESAHPGAVAAPSVRVTGLIGVVSPFDGNPDDWIEYAERLEYYFTANDIVSAAKKRAILLNGAGASTYWLIKTLLLLGAPTDLSFEEIVKRVTTQFKPKPSPIVKRFEFNTRVQKDGESVAEFVAALRKITEFCEYGSFLNDMLRDRLVCGIRDKKVQRRFLQESKLTYKEAFDMALAAETADKDAKRLQAGYGEEKPPVEVEVHQVSKNAPRGESQANTCYRCGGKHQQQQCKFTDYTCHFCKKKGHLASVCRNKKRAAAQSEPKKERAHRVD